VDVECALIVVGVEVVVADSGPTSTLFVALAVECIAEDVLVCASSTVNK
jgi:hypothetical protein